MYQIDWNLTWATVSAIATAASTILAFVCSRKANKAQKALNEIVEIKNNITTNIQNAVEIAVKNEIQSTASATASASVTNIINDDEAIKRISAAVANELISKKTPKFTSKEGMLEMKIPDSSHSLRFEHK